MTNKKSTIHDLYTRNDNTVSRGQHAAPLQLPPHPALSLKGRESGAFRVGLLLDLGKLDLRVKLDLCYCISQ